MMAYHHLNSLSDARYIAQTTDSLDETETRPKLSYLLPEITCHKGSFYNLTLRLFSPV